MPARLIVFSGVVASAAAIVVLATVSGSGPSRSGDAAGPAVGAAPAVRGSADVEVTIPSRPTLTSVPRSFLGISTEYWSIPLWANHLSLLDRVLSLLRVDGPLTLRIGGDSADQTFLATRHELPEWTYEVNSTWLKQATGIVRGAGVRLILDLNLVTTTTRIAAQWAQSAEAHLPHGSILGFELGNEPDIYLRAYWRKKLAGYTGLPELPEKVTAKKNAEAFVNYSRALRRVVPGVPLLAPALAKPEKHASWVTRLLAGSHQGLRVVTAHRYPYSACARRPTSPTHPTIARVLSENATAGMAQTTRSILRVSERARLPLALTEINSVTCGGTRGVSDTFATALWAPDALFELLRAGNESADVHIRPRTINLAFALNTHGLVAHPLLYGMILFARALGPHAQLVPLRQNSRRPHHLKAWAVRVKGNVLHVLLINKGRTPLQVSLHVPASDPATVQRLRAPSASSRSNVQLDGQHLNQQGRWHGRSVGETLTPSAHGYQVAVPRLSAALVAVKLRTSALAGTNVHTRN